MSVPVIFGWRSRLADQWTGLLRCPFCGGEGVHEGYHVERSFTLYRVAVVPLWSDRRVICGHCGHKRSVKSTEYDRLRQAALGRRALHDLRRVDPEAAERISRDVITGKASDADLLFLVAQAQTPTVKEAEAQLGAEGRLPPTDRE